jgi:hypothetical protein
VESNVGILRLSYRTVRMVLSKIIFVVLLDFLAVSTALRSSYVSRNQFQSIVHENEVVLVACESPKRPLVSTKVSSFVIITSSDDHILNHH